MAKLSKKDMEELREFCSLGCDYSGTEEIVNELITDTLKELCSEEYLRADEIELNLDGEFISTLDEFVREFWEKAVEAILNVVETQGR